MGPSKLRPTRHFSILCPNKTQQIGGLKRPTSLSTTETRNGDSPIWGLMLVSWASQIGLAIRQQVLALNFNPPSWPSSSTWVANSGLDQSCDSLPLGLNSRMEFVSLNLTIWRLICRHLSSASTSVGSPSLGLNWALSLVPDCSSLRVHGTSFESQALAAESGGSERLDSSLISVDVDKLGGSISSIIFGSLPLALFPLGWPTLDAEARDLSIDFIFTVRPASRECSWSPAGYSSSFACLSSGGLIVASLEFALSLGTKKSLSRCFVVGGSNLGPDSIRRDRIEGDRWRLASEAWQGSIELQVRLQKCQGEVTRLIPLAVLLGWRGIRGNVT